MIIIMLKHKQLKTPILRPCMEEWKNTIKTRKTSIIYRFATNLTLLALLVSKKSTIYEVDVGMSCQLYQKSEL